MVKVVEKFEILEVKLPISVSEIGIVPLAGNQDLMLIGGFNEKERSLKQLLKFTAVQTMIGDGS